LGYKWEFRITIHPETKDIIIYAVGECITNAYKYAESKELKLTVSEDEGRQIICIVNEGEHPAGKIEEKGGLLNLRKKLEKNGGTMEVKEEPCFTLTITMEKRKFI